MTAVLDVPLAAASGTAIGTGSRLVVTEPPALDRGQALLKAYLAALDAACSRFRPDSELISPAPERTTIVITHDPRLAAQAGSVVVLGDRPLVLHP